MTRGKCWEKIIFVAIFKWLRFSTPSETFANVLCACVSPAIPVLLTVTALLCRIGSGEFVREEQVAGNMDILQGIQDVAVEYPWWVTLSK